MVRNIAEFGIQVMDIDGIRFNNLHTSDSRFKLTLEDGYNVVLRFKGTDNTVYQ